MQASRAFVLRGGLAALLLILSVRPALAAPSFQGNDPAEKAAALLAGMSSEEKVGQLFLITFEGNQALPESRIYELIANSHIGGVILESEHNNFVGAPSTMEVLPTLIRGLQDAETNSSLDTLIDPVSGEVRQQTYVPVFVGLEQDGDGFPHDQILSGLSPQPNPMTLGATWNPDLARSAGALLGDELAQLGINLLLGPSLDILEDPSPDNSGSLGTQSFGGDQYWVSLMGSAYIEGVHQGSDNRVAVVVKHLPGFGSSDRPLEEEIPTIRKSLAELAQLELVPFFAVTGNAVNQDARADAMLLSHIRYQGFQGNIRATTNPVSFDPQAFGELMALEEFAAWREEGGIVISDNLGSRAVRRDFDPTEQSFNAPEIALDAFLAGNDLLFLGDFSADGSGESYDNVVSTAQFFTQKYNDDAAFAERVDQAVLRILTLKYKLYPNFSLVPVAPQTRVPSSFGENTELIFEVGLEAASLLSPEAEQLTEVMPTSPRIDQRVVFIVDTYLVSQCDVCPLFSAVSPSSFEAAVERLYGPVAGNRIAPGNVSSFSFRELIVGLDTDTGDENLLMSNLQSADWVVFGLLEESNEREESRALERLLEEQPALLQDKNIIVFALGAPVYLDATEVSKVSAYYALYGKHTLMADIAARLLFQEISAPGAPPINVSGIGYELISAMSPDPERIIPISASEIPLNGESEAPSGETELEATEETVLALEAGDRINISAGPILDQNGNPVPDNTPVEFAISINDEDSALTRNLQGTSSNAIATVTYSIESEGTLQISASAGDPAASSDILLFEVVGINPEGLALQATELSPTPTSSGELAQSEGSDAEEAAVMLPRLQLADWFLSVLVSFFMALLAFQIGSSVSNVRKGVQWGYAALIGGLVSTSYMALNFPGSEALFTRWAAWGIAAITVLAAALGWLLAWLAAEFGARRA